MSDPLMLVLAIVAAWSGYLARVAHEEWRALRRQFRQPRWRRPS